MTSPIRYELQINEYEYDPTRQHRYIEKTPFIGGEGNDVLVGNDKDNLMEGKSGDDIFIGREGSDIIRGGRGSDLVEYFPSGWIGGGPGSSKGVIVNLQRGFALDFFRDRDELSSIEHVWGTYRNDEIIGNHDDNDIAGADGDDKLLGIAGDNLLYGGLGKDFKVGGRNSDAFLYLDKDEGGDRIEGFQSGVDQILIRGSSFLLEDNPAGYPVGELEQQQFFLGSSATNDRQLFGYNPATNQVLYDSNGARPGGVTFLATLTGIRSGIVASDIVIYE